jgi:hypothetical protein
MQLRHHTEGKKKVLAVVRFTWLIHLSKKMAAWYPSVNWCCLCESPRVQSGGYFASTDWGSVLVGAMARPARRCGHNSARRVGGRRISCPRHMLELQRSETSAEAIASRN